MGPIAHSSVSERPELRRIAAFRNLRSIPKMGGRRKALSFRTKRDPQIRLTRRVNGKTVAESFPSPSAWRKAQSEIDEYHRFEKLNAELIAVNEKICQHRPVESEDGTWTPEEKKRLLRSLRRSATK